MRRVSSKRVSFPLAPPVIDVEVATCPMPPPAWGRLRFWHSSDSGSVSGTSGAVYLDPYNGSRAELRGL